jgi:signal transduction histidine kinase
MAGERILVADDEPDVREMCARTLRRAGYAVAGASSGQEAIERMRLEHFDLLLTDLKMPQMGGLEAYHTLHATNPDLVAVVMTGFGTMEAAIEALRLGVSEFVLKPFRTAELTEAVERALGRQRLQRENARLKALIPLFDLSRAFMSSVDLAVIPQHVVRIAQQELRADNASLMLLDAGGELTIHSAIGLPGEVVATTRQKADQGIAGYAITHREPVIVQGDPRNDPRFGELHSSEQVRSAICLPLVHKDKVLGVLNVSRIEQPVPFTESDVELLSVLGSQAAIAIDNARMFQEIQTAYQKLAELDHLKSEFISIAAHELRSPLAVVLTYAALLEAEATGKMRQHLGQVTLASMQLKSIIDEMISLREIDTGQAQVTLGEVVVAETVEHVLEDLRLLASRKHQDIQVQIPPDLPAARSDPRLVFLILSNLLSNAIKFTPEQGSITITAQSDDSRVIATIHDTGVGIPAAELERIFQRFYQVEDSLRRKHGGIGLGLAIAREMADLIGAQIEVASTEGEGSAFSLVLPRATA